MISLWFHIDLPQLSANNGIQCRFNLFWYQLMLGGRQGMPALPKRQWRLDVTHTHDLYIYPLWVKIQLHSIKSEAQRCLLNCHLEGFLRAATVLKLWGNLFASANPLFLLFFSLLSFVSVCVFLYLLIFLLLFRLSLSVPALLNISSYVSDTFAKISWTAREEQQDSQLYVAYMNNRKLLFLSPPCEPFTWICGGIVFRCN